MRDSPRVTAQLAVPLPTLITGEANHYVDAVYSGLVGLYGVWNARTLHYLDNSAAALAHGDGRLSGQ